MSCVQGARISSLPVCSVHGMCVKLDRQTRPRQVDVRVCVTTETRHLDRLGQLVEFEQESNTGSARSKAQLAPQSTAEPDEKAPQAKSRALSKHTPLSSDQLCV